MQLILVDGEWLPWTEWESCSASCNGGQQSRSRSCQGQDHGGKPCDGNSTETRNCNENILCPGKSENAEWLRS